MSSSIPLTLPLATGPVMLTLFADGALHWPAAATLFIADPHFGKSATFHHAGIAIPDAVHLYDLTRLSQLLIMTRANRLIILGDFFHTHHSRTSATMFNALLSWRQTHAHVAMLLVGGNHDLHAGAPPPELAIPMVDAPYALDPFTCLHIPSATHPAATAPATYFLAGHLHPRALLRDRTTQLRLPCFWVRPHQMVLPAFGGFTGGATIHPSASDRIFVIAEGHILKAPTLGQHR